MWPRASTDLAQHQFLWKDFVALEGNGNRNEKEQALNWRFWPMVPGVWVFCAGASETSGAGGESEIPSFYLFFYVWGSTYDLVNSKKKKKRIQKIIPCYLEILEAMRSFLILELTFSPSAHPLGTEPCKDAISSTVHRHGGQELKHGWHPLIMPISKR